MDSKNVTDVSSFLLFEASGDSEADGDLYEYSIDNDVANDDAESCSCDSSDYVRVIEFVDCSVPGYDYEDDEEEGEVVDQIWTNEKMGTCMKVRVCIGTKKEPMDEVEKNRLFWETCLAS